MQGSEKYIPMVYALFLREGRTETVAHAEMLQSVAASADVALVLISSACKATKRGAANSMRRGRLICKSRTLGRGLDMQMKSTLLTVETC